MNIVMDKALDILVNLVAIIFVLAGIVSMGVTVITIGSIYYGSFTAIGFFIKLALVLNIVLTIGFSWYASKVLTDKEN